MMKLTEEKRMQVDKNSKKKKNTIVYIKLFKKKSFTAMCFFQCGWPLRTTARW